MVRYITLFAILLGLTSIECEAQFLKKLKQKANKGLLKEIGVGEEEKKNNPVDASSNSSNPSSSSNAQNKRGGGLKLAPPDVMANIADAPLIPGNKKLQPGEICHPGSYAWR